jgi:hypothetical protein
LEADECVLKEDSSDDDSDDDDQSEDHVPLHWRNYDFFRCTVNTGENVPWEYTENEVCEGSMYPSTVDAKRAPSAKHTASRTSWLYTRRESRDVPVNFSRKLTKEKGVRYQSLELAGWYQTVPYLRLGSQMG